MLLLMAAMVIGLANTPPVVAVEPFALPDQITDQVGAVRGHVGEIRAAFDTLHAQHGVRMWVVFVDSFDGTDPQQWADATFAATGLGVHDYVLAVAMTDRTYGYVVDDDFVLDDAALMRVSIAAQGHLAESPSRAVTAAARAIGDNITGDMGPASPTSDLVSRIPDGFIVVVVMGLFVAYAVVKGIRRVRQGLPFFEPGSDTSDHGWSPGGSDDGWSGGDTWSSGGGSSGGSSGGGGGGGTRGGGGTF
jgi:hypothetical protein